VIRADEEAKGKEHKEAAEDRQKNLSNLNESRHTKKARKQ